MRLAWLSHTPPGLWFDEARNIDQFDQLRHGIYHREFFDQQPLYVLFLALGFGMKGLTVTGLRLSSAIAGILTVPLLHWAVRPMYGRRVARWSGFILAVLPWHMIFSRIGFRTATAPLMQALCFGFLWRAMTGARSGRYSIALGVANFLGMFSYISFLVTPVLLLLMFFVKRIKARVRFWPAVSIVTSTLAAFLLMVYLQSGTGNGIAHARVAEEQNFQPRMWLSAEGPPANALRTAGMFVWRGDTNGRHNVPGAAQIPRWLFPLLILGMVREMRERSARSWTVLAWWVAGLLPTVFSRYCPHAGRALCAALPTCILIARGGSGLVSYLVISRSFGRRVSLSRGVGALGAVVLAASGMWQYFHVYGRSYSVWEQFQSGPVEAAQYLQKLPRGSVVLREPFQNGVYSFDVLTRVAGLDVRPLRSSDDLVRLAPEAAAPFYYVAVGRDRFGSEFMQTYPDARQEQVFRDQDGRPFGVLFRVR